MNTSDLEKAIQAALAPIMAELMRIRELLERDASTAERTLSSPTEAPAASNPPSISPPREGVPPQPPADPLPIPPAASPAIPTSPPGSPAAGGSGALLRALLADYPDDAAAVYFAFHRQQRCAPEALDRLARKTGVEDAWTAANRATVRALIERQRGGLAAVAELMGRDTDSLQALVDRLGLREHVEAVRSRERARVQRAPLAERVWLLLHRERLLQDLGMRTEQETLVQHELAGRCASLAGECDDANAVLERLGEECRLDAAGLERLLRKFDLGRFAGDLYQDLGESEMRPALRRAARPEASRRPLEDGEIEARILRMLLAKRKVGSAHTHIDHLVRTVPTHERGRARAIIERLVSEGTLVIKVTDNSAEPHVSLAVAALPLVEQRLRGTESATGGSTCAS